jgi:F-type H+-transporting ATPase subunit b
MHVDLTTLLLQTVNLLILLALLRRLFYRPVMAVIEARQQALADQQAQAQAEREAVLARQAELARAQAELQASRQGILDGAREEAARLRDAAQAAARDQLRALSDEAARQRALDFDAAAAQLFEQAAELASTLAARLLRESPGWRAADFLTALLARAEATTTDERRAWWAADEALEVVIATSEALDAAEQAACATRLQALADGPMTLRWCVEPALLRGAEIRAPHGVLSLHWAGALADARAAWQAPPPHQAP